MAYRQGSADVFAARLQQVMQEKDLHQKDIAAQTGWNISTVKQYTSGTRVPGYGNMKKLTDVLGVSSDWLLGRSDFRTEEEQLKKTYADPAEANLQFEDAVRHVLDAIKDLGYDTMLGWSEGYYGRAYAERIAKEVVTEYLIPLCETKLRKKGEEK